MKQAAAALQKLAMHWASLRFAALRLAAARFMSHVNPLIALTGPKRFDR
jgi:hypothetical protein